MPVIGVTEAEARALEDELEELIIPEYALAQLAQMLEVPPEHARPGPPLPGDLTPRTRSRAPKSRYTLIVDLARREQPDRPPADRPARRRARAPHLRRHARAGRRHHRGVVRHGAADGFNMMPPVLPSGLETFVEHVIPILRKRGLFRTEYDGPTLRDHYGLPRPDSQFAVAATRDR